MSLMEQAGYFEVSGAHLYTVLHAVPNPVARVLMVGPFAWERHCSYVPWVRWARYLAGQGIECLRFDYRGIGESTGGFEAMTFDDWSEDVELLALWLRGRSPGLPLVLHGIEMGALLGARVFASGAGDALLMWSAPNSANEVLRPALQRRVTIDNMFRYGAERRGLEDYVGKLNSEPMEIEGYQWSSQLWRDSFEVKLPSGMREASGSYGEDGRPLRMVALDKSAEPLVKGSAYVSINPDLRQMFAENLRWIVRELRLEARKVA